MKPELEPHQKKARANWLKFLNPDSLRANLLLASLYLSAYEVLCSSIIDQIKSFFTVGWSQAGDTVDPRYTEEVLRLHKNPLSASALWLQQRGIIDAADIKKLDSIREHRNAIAHNLPRFVSTTDAEVDTNLFQEICELVAKIDRWWIVQVEISTNPDFDDRDADLEGVQSGSMIFLHLLVEIATSATDDPAYYYNELKKHFTKDADPCDAANKLTTNPPPSASRA